MIGKLEELKLVARCVTLADEDAFRRLVDAYSPAVRNFLFRLTMGDAMLCDDLSQETFLKAWTSMASFRAAARFKTWLLSIAYRQYLTYLRKYRECSIAGDQLSDIADKSDVSNDNGMLDKRYDVDSALRVLSPNERAVIDLFYLQDLPIKQVSRITMLPEGTVKSHLSRAKNKMAQFLKQ